MKTSSTSFVVVFLSFSLIFVCFNLKPNRALLLVPRPETLWPLVFRSHWMEVSNGSSGEVQESCRPHQLPTLHQPTRDSSDGRPAGTFSAAAAAESRIRASPSLTKTSPLFSPVVCIHLSAGRLFLWVATNYMTHLWSFFKKTNVSKNNFMTIIKIFIASLCK